MEENVSSEGQKNTLPEPNPVTRAAHRRDFFRRVTLPLVIGLIFIIGLVVTFIFVPVGDVETWSQIATILLISLGLLMGLLALVLLVALVYLVTYLLRFLPPYTRMAQDGIEKIKLYTEKGADIPTKPVIQVSSFIAAMNALFRRKP